MHPKPRFRSRPRPPWRPAAAVLLGLALGACADSVSERTAPRVTPPQQGFIQLVAHDPADRMGHPRPRIVTPARKLQCVAYARRHSRIEIRGDAWTWWGKAEGRYGRGAEPAVGSVLVLGRKGASRGHLAVVTRVVGPREVIASHANWLNRGRVHIDTPIRDVSPDNDWTAVRVWYTPANVLGKSVYPAYGFIYPPTDSAKRI